MIELADPMRPEAGTEGRIRPPLPASVPRGFDHGGDMASILYVRIKSDLAPDELDRRLLERRLRFLEVPGLTQKVYGRDPATGDLCGIYFFESREALAAFRDSELARTIPDAYEATEVRRESTTSSIRSTRNAARCPSGARVSRSETDASAGRRSEPAAEAAGEHVAHAPDLDLLVGFDVGAETVDAGLDATPVLAQLGDHDQRATMVLDHQPCEQAIELGAARRRQPVQLPGREHSRHQS
ncbi:MAG TPA: hypothetical protein VK919_06835 [Solirubrobacterales bacterium]|nr:hypothetical protein [Solirubrobacterales bacterium]